MAHKHLCLNCSAVIAEGDFDCDEDRDHDLALCDECEKPVDYLLNKGRKYDVGGIHFVGWTDGDGSGHEGYNVYDYFVDGVYQGPDAHGIEPIARTADPRDEER